MPNHTSDNCRVPFCSECLDRIKAVRNLADNMLDKAKTVHIPEEQSAKNAHTSDDELLKYFWPHPYPRSNPPLEVTFSNGLPTSSSDRIHKVFVVPYSTFKIAIEAITTAREQAAYKQGYIQCGLDSQEKANG